jgi:hypothetical protein
MRRFVSGLALVCLIGCSRVRSTDEISTEKRQMPRLFLTAKTHTRVVGVKTQGMFKDDATGEDSWPALQCTNPDCPGRNGEEPALFICFDVSASKGCPACAKKRNFKTESDADRAKYLKFVEPYELPEVRARLHALDEEFKLASMQAQVSK